MWSSSPDHRCQVRSAAQNAQTDVTDIILVELLFHEDQEYSYILLTFGNTAVHYIQMGIGSLMILLLWGAFKEHHINIIYAVFLALTFQ